MKIIIIITAMCSLLLCCHPIRPTPDATPVAGEDAATPVPEDGAPVAADSSLAPGADASFPLSLDAPPPGGVILTISTAEQSLNCSPGGAGVTAMTVLLSDASGTCVVANYTTSHMADHTMCPDPVTIECIEVGDSLTIRPLPLGSYHALITGLIGDAPCWSGDASIGIVADANTSQNLTLTKKDNCP